MPDDSSPEQQTKQQKHAERIRTERALMRATGLTRSDLRLRLSRFAEENRQFAQLVERRIAQQQGPAEPIRSREVSMSPTGFAAGQNAHGTPPPPNLQLQAISVCVNGEPGIQLLYGEPAVPL